MRGLQSDTLLKLRRRFAQLEQFFDLPDMGHAIRATARPPRVDEWILPHGHPAHEVVAEEQQDT